MQFPHIADKISNLQNKVLYAPLAEIDPEVQNIIDKETWRQFTGLELIASEVWMSVLVAVSNHFSDLIDRTSRVAQLCKPMVRF